MKTQNILQDSESASTLKVAFWGLSSELNLVLLIYGALSQLPDYVIDTKHKQI